MCLPQKQQAKAAEEDRFEAVSMEANGGATVVSGSFWRESVLMAASLLHGGDVGLVQQ